MHFLPRGPPCASGEVSARPYVRDLASLPEPGCIPTPLEDILLPADRWRHGDGGELLLRPEDEGLALQRDMNLRQPYMDPVLNR